jgi:Uma2 family endonuclease
MATATRKKIDYPTSDGRPMAETDLHRDLMVELIQTLQTRYAEVPNVYVSGNLLVFYKKGDRRRHLSPDVFVVRGVAKHRRDNYLIWEEGKGPEVVIELTSQSTRDEDIDDKYDLYASELHVPEYFLFDPYGEYLQPSLRGYRLREGEYVSIRAVAGRLPSKVLGLHLERHGTQLRLYDPKTGHRLPTPSETVAREIAARQRAEAEAERLRRELEELRHGPKKS